MGAAHNDDELARLIMQDIQSAVQETEVKAVEDMKIGMEYFYSGGPPRVYKRTERLKHTPRTSQLRVTKTRAQFDAYLEDSGSYTTGKHPSMAQVLDLTETGSSPGLRPAVGNTGYWELTCDLIENDFDRAMQQYFD